MMHGRYPRSLRFVFTLSDHPTLGRELKCYLGTSGCLASMMIRGHWWWIWTLVHIAIFSKVQVHDPQGREGSSNFSLSFKKDIRSSLRSLFSIQAVGRVVSATNLIYWNSQLSFHSRSIAHLYLPNQWEDDDRDEILQLRHLTVDSNDSKQFVERSDPKQGVVRTSGLCQHHLIVFQCKERLSGCDCRVCGWNLCYHQLLPWNFVCVASPVL